MISLDQLRILQSKVSMMVQKYRTIVEENELLKRKLRGYEQRVSEMESHYSTIKEDQNEMEKTILSALEELDKIEDQFGREPTNSGIDSTDNSAHRHPDGDLEM